MITFKAPSNSILDYPLLNGNLAKELSKFTDEEIMSSMEATEDMYLAKQRNIYLDTCSPVGIAVAMSSNGQKIPKQMMLSRQLADKGFSRSKKFYENYEGNESFCSIRSYDPVDYGLLGAAINYLGAYLVQKADYEIGINLRGPKQLSTDMASIYLSIGRDLPIEPATVKRVERTKSTNGITDAIPLYDYPTDSTEGQEFKQVFEDNLVVSGYDAINFDSISDPFAKAYQKSIAYK
jgi:hypothetical protein